MKSKVLILSMVAAMFASCAIIQPGEVGVKQRLGKLDAAILEEGPHGYNPFTTNIITVPIRTENIEISVNLPSKEGLNVGAEISILYRIEKEIVPELVKNLGQNYEGIIRNVFRSASADVCAEFFAKDMHSGNRSKIETAIKDKMAQTLIQYGIVTENVLMKTINLPPGLYASIENRLQAEQDALRMQFILEQEKLEAQRKIIEATGTKDAQLILSEGLTPEIIQLRSIEAFLKLAESPNSKVIITDNGQVPIVMQKD